MGLIETEGVVLRGSDYGEAHRILRFYTWKYGKISVLAKGVKKTKSRLAGLCQPFSYGRYLFFQGTNMYTLSQGEILRSYRQLYDDLDMMAYGSYFCELVDLLTEDEQENQMIFMLLLQGFVLLSYGKNLSLAALFFEFRILVYSGYRPNWELAGLSPEAKAICKRFLHKEGWRVQNLKISSGAQKELKAYLKAMLKDVLPRRPHSLDLISTCQHLDI